MKTNFRKVLILAAGRGKRLMPLTANRPKCLVEIGGRPILFWQLSALSICGIKNVVMVVGYRGSMIEKYVVKNFPRLSVQFIQNPQYQNTDKLYSWLLAKDSIKGGLLSMDSDIIFHPAIISAALSVPRETNAALFCKRKCQADETKISVSSDGTVFDIGKDLKLKDTSGKFTPPPNGNLVGGFTGIYVFSKNFSQLFLTVAKGLLNSHGQHFFGFDVIRKIRDKQNLIVRGLNINRHPFMRDATENTIRKIKDEQNLLIRGLDVSQYPFAEIDSLEDLRIAESEVLPGIVSAIFNKKITDH